MNKREKWLFIIGTTVLAFWLNRAFLKWMTLPTMLDMNDVPAVLRGYRQTPHLLIDGLRWWTGTWIQDGIHAYRPLASYLYWIESDIGLRWGFIWVGWIGVLLLTANALLAGVLAWRLTSSKLCICIAALLSVCMRFYNWGNTTPDYWLAWYPIHQELLMNALLIGAIINFDVWLDSAKNKYLIGTWLCFVLGALTKEHVYIFPIFAFVIAIFRRKNSRVEFKWVLMQCTLMLAVLLALWFYRAGILVDARNPSLKRIHFVRKPWLYIFYPFYKHILTEQYWFPGLALLLFALGGVLLRWKHSAKSYLLQRSFVPMIAGFCIIAIIALYCEITFSATQAFWYLFDTNGDLHCFQLFAMMATIYAVYLLWKYRKTEPTALAFTMLVLAYVPVITYLGWHYTVPAAFIRSAYWGLVAKLVWLDVSPVLLSHPKIQWLQSRIASTSKTSESALV